MGFVDHIAFHARYRPASLAAYDFASDRWWTYRDLDRDVARLTTVLRKQGLREGDRVASFARNATLLVMVHHACARLGLIYVPLNWRLSAAEIASLIAHAEPSLLLHDDGEDRGCPAMSLEALRRSMEDAEEAPAGAIDPDRTSLILFTSGTTGRPKGVQLSERNIDQTAINFGQLGAVDGRSAMLIDAPMFHVLGLVTTVRSALRCGARILVSQGFDPAATLARLGDRALAVTHYFCVPQMAAALRTHRDFSPRTFRGLTALFTGGAAISAAEVDQWLRDGIVVANGYGMSECGTITGMPADPLIVGSKLTSAGLPTPGIEIRMVDHAERTVANGVPGELQVRGDNVTSGYWQMQAETDAAFTTDGWFRTGDIAVQDEEGYVTIIDRRKDMYISGGENVYPAEVEAALAGLPGVRELAVVGVPDPKWGEVGHLAVVVDGASGIDLALVHAHLEGKLARYKFPGRCTAVPGIPRTPSGKVCKAELRDQLAR